MNRFNALWVAIVITVMTIMGCTHTYDPPSTFEADTVDLGMSWLLVQQDYDAFNFSAVVYDGDPSRVLDAVKRSYMVVNGDTLIIDREFQLSRWSLFIPREEEVISLTIVTPRERLSYSMLYPDDNGIVVPKTVSRTSGAQLVFDPPLGAQDSVFITINAAVGGTRRDIRTYVHSAEASTEFVFSGEEISKIAAEGTNLRCDVWRTSWRAPQGVFPAGLQIRIEYRKEQVAWTVTP